MTAVENKGYTMSQILDVIRELSMSQGFYGRLLRNIEGVKESDPEKYSEIVKELEEQNFSDPLDVILYFEQ